MGSMDGVSGWEDFLGNICKPERQQAVDRLTRTFVNELVVSYLKRSRYGLKIAVLKTSCRLSAISCISWIGGLRVLKIKKNSCGCEGKSVNP